MLMYATPTFNTEVLQFFTQVQLFFNDCCSELTVSYSAGLLLLELVFMMRFNFKVTPTTDYDCSCQLKAVEFV